MVEEIEHRVQRLIRETWDTHTEVFAVFLADLGVDTEEQVERLNRLILSFRSSELEDTIFDNGRRVATHVNMETEPPTIRLNRELLNRVTDADLLSALARPIAQILELPQLSVAVVVQHRDEKSLKSLAPKSGRANDIKISRAHDVPAFVEDKIDRFARRLEVLAQHFGSATKIELRVSEELCAALRGKPAWPDWIDVSDVGVLKEAIEVFDAAIADSDIYSERAGLIELIWDGLGLSAHSYLRNAGRTLRSLESLDVERVIRALGEGCQCTDHSFCPALSTWATLADLYDAWVTLNRTEESIFGVSTVEPELRMVSVLEPVRVSFGINEPPELPWDLPLVCWTAREQGALRDLFVGVTRTLPSSAEHEFFSLASLERPEEPALTTFEGNRANLGIQVIAVGFELVASDSLRVSRAWSAVKNRLLEQFDELPSVHQLEANRLLRRAYDDYFPEHLSIWARRFYRLDNLSDRDAYEQLITEVQRVLNAPVLFDIFVKPGLKDVAPFPTLTFTVGMSAGFPKTPVWIPLSAVASTVHGAPLRVRSVGVTGDLTSTCTWLCDRSLHLTKLQGQPVDLIIRAVHGDALQFAVFG